MLHRTDNFGIAYDQDLKLMSIHPSAWALTPLFRWFNNYTIISKIKNPLDSRLPIVYITDYLDANDKVPVTVRDMKQSPALDKLIENEQLGDHKMVMSKPPVESSSISYLSNDYQVASNYENKVWIRQHFGTKLPFAKYSIITNTPGLKLRFNDLTSKLKTSGLVLQHPKESGGMGTYVVTSQSQLDTAVAALSKRLVMGDTFVISALLANKQERSLQVCITENEVLIGPAQAQLVAHPFLTSNIEGSMQFCGGMIANDLLTEEMYQEAQRIASIVAADLKKTGYKGIFGIDLLIAGGQLFILEVNARLTGLSALLAFLQARHPFLLIHILELAGEQFSLQPVGDSLKPVGEGSFILAYAQQDTLVSTKTGVYDSKGNYIRLGFEDNNILPINHSEYFIAMKRSVGSVAPAGKSLAFIYARKRLFTDEGELDPGIIKLVEMLREQQG